METDIVQYLPTYFRDIVDYSQLMSAEAPSLESFAQYMGVVHDNFFVSTADAGTVSDWEKLFGITAAPAETLDFRRARILNRLAFNPPFTLKFLYDRLDAMIGHGAWSVVVDYANYTLYIEATAENQQWASEVEITINAVKPCHIVYINRPLVLNSIAMSETVSLSETAYNYRLGYWGLGSSPFSQSQEKGVIVTAGQMSLQSSMLSDVASFAASDVASARLNGNVIISAFEKKSASGNTATISYTVTAAQANPITQIELLNSSGAVLESAAVYVPVSSPVQITHRIPVKEATA